MCIITLTFLYTYVFSLYVYGCFTSIASVHHVCIVLEEARRGVRFLELELQTGVSWHDCWELNLSRLKEQQVFLTAAEPSLQLTALFILIHWAMILKQAEQRLRWT